MTQEDDDDGCLLIQVAADIPSLEECTAFVNDPSCGAISSFIGITRDNFQGKKVVKLSYEGYVPMAIKELTKLCQAARLKYHVSKIAAVHILGDCPVGDASVILACSSPHRRDAIHCVEFLIDELKATVPIWKRELYEGDESVWKENVEWKAGQQQRVMVRVDKEDSNGATPTNIATDFPMEKMTMHDTEGPVVLVKIGGSSITKKSEKECLDSSALDWFANAVAASLADRFKRKDERAVDEVSHSSSLINKSRFVLVHGAGSFGHFSAKQYGLRGQDDAPPPSQDGKSLSEDMTCHRMRGLVETRLSVQKLNQKVVESLVDKGINAVGISPGFSVPGLEAHLHKQVEPRLDLERLVKRTLEAGLVPVLHGDACLYGRDNTGILSGDTIVEVLGASRWVERTIFITDVDGVFTEDPRNEPNAVQLRTILVDPVSRSIVTDLTATGSSHHHDVTGGLETKLKSAAAIAGSGSTVTIVKCQSKSAEQALKREETIDVASFVSSKSD